MMTQINNKDLIAETMEDSTFWNVHDDLKGMTLEQLQEIQRKETLPYAVCALNLTGDLNVGMMARTACLHGASQFIIFGRRKYDKRSTVGAQNYMPVHRVDGFVGHSSTFSVEKFLQVMEDHRLYPIAIEQDGSPIDLLSDGEWADLIGYGDEDAPHPCLIFGNENEGIPEDILNECVATLSLRQRGVLRSMNVSAAAAIAIYEFSKNVWKMSGVKNKVLDILT